MRFDENVALGYESRLVWLLVVHCVMLMITLLLLMIAASRLLLK